MGPEPGLHQRLIHHLPGLRRHERGHERLVHQLGQLLQRGGGGSQRGQPAAQPHEAPRAEAQLLVLRVVCERGRHPQQPRGHAGVQRGEQRLQQPPVRVSGQRREVEPAEEREYVGREPALRLLLPLAAPRLRQRHHSEGRVDGQYGGGRGRGGGGRAEADRRVPSQSSTSLWTSDAGREAV
jgi:hypothetical protein